MWWWTRKEKIIWMYRVQNAVLRRVKEEMNILHAIKWRTGHILSSNCCIKHVIEGQVGQIEGTRRWERIRKQLLDDLKTRKHWELKEEAIVCTLWRTRFARGYGTVVRQDTLRNDELYCVKISYTEFPYNLSRNTGSMGTNWFKPLSRIWLALSRYSWNSILLYT
jgi:hypothetical protein